MNPRLSRRRLSLCGLSLVLATLAVSSPLAAGASSSTASREGRFEMFTTDRTVQKYAEPPSPAVGINMVLMKTGMVLVFGPFAHSNAPWPAAAYVWNPTPGAPADGFVKEVDPPDHIFCTGMAVLSDGTVVVTGNALLDDKLSGPPLTFTFDPVSMTWLQQPNVPYGRYYGTNTELADGDIISTSGGDETGTLNQTIDVLEPGTPYVKDITTPPIMDYSELYPRQWLMPDGKVVSYEDKAGFLIDTTNADPQKWTSTAIPSSKFEHGGVGPASVLLPGGLSGPTRMVVIGGGGAVSGDCGAADCSTFGTNRVEELNYSDLSKGWKSLAPTPGPGRVHSNAVLLPDGTVFLAGGNTDGDWNDPQHQELLFNPQTDKWKTAASNDASINRGYHSNALLLPDGAVLLGGDNGGAVIRGKTVWDNGERLEVYDPPYLFKGPRPVITSSPANVVWGSAFNVATPSAVSKVVLVAPGVSTHSVDMNQRNIVLPFVTGGASISVTAPGATVAPPGSYMLFLLNAAGVPSVAQWIHVGGPLPVVSGLSVSGGPSSGGTSVIISGSGFAKAVGVKFGEAGATFSVLSDTQIAATSPVPVTFGLAGRTDVTVETATAQSATGPADTFAYQGPFITAVDSAAGPAGGGTTIQISGSNFGVGDVVLIGTNRATIGAVTSTSISAVTPPGRGLQAVSVRAPNGYTSPLVSGVTEFSYAPSIGIISDADGPLAVRPSEGPSSGSGAVTIRGDNFTGTTGVRFGSKPAKSWVVVSDTAIRAVPPSEGSEPSYVDVTVISPGGTSQASELDVFCWYNRSKGQTRSACASNPGYPGS